jgi:uncharacterized protein
MLKRKILDRLIEWKENKSKHALLVKGARQVGKTFIIREFGKTFYKRFVEINFEEKPLFKRVFSGNLDARTILLNLSAMGLGDFMPENTLFFFDEIQSCPEARTAIKFLVEDGRYDYIESGSLLGINYKDVSSYPVGFEEQITMYPLDFEEFLWAKNISQEVIQSIHRSYKEMIPVDDFMHEQLSKYYREYLIVGGMPKAVNTFITNDDFSQTLRIQNIIAANYRDDIAKYSGDRKELVKNMYDAIPEQLNKKNKRFILASLGKGTRAQKYEEPSMWLTDAGIAYHCFNLSALELPLSFSEKRNLYKFYMHDTGILCAMATKGIQALILHGEIDVNEGSITENAVASALVTNGIPLYYFDKNSRNELDFVFADRQGISIIEVKSGKGYKSHASLDQAPELAQTKLVRRIVLSKYNVETSMDGILYLPLYMSMFIK